MALVDVSRLLNERGTLFNKFRGAVILSAASVYAEAPETENHTNRLLWAENVLLTGQVDQRAEELYRLAMTNAQVTTSGDATPDGDVEWIVAHFLNTVARG
jgi:hypothetical protein